MANELKWTTVAAVTLEASGASAASNVFVQADDATNLGSAQHSNFPLADFAFCAYGGWSTTVGSGKSINLYRNDVTIDGTNTVTAPTASHKSLFVGAFTVQDAAASASGTASGIWYGLPNVPLNLNCGFYIENGTDVSLNAGWKLTCRPKSYVPGS